MNNSTTYKRHPIHHHLFVGDNGTCYNTSGKNTILNPSPNSKGYVKIKLTINKIKKTISMHRLVLETFEGISDKEVNHKNKITTDNSVGNLEYCTRSQNMLHAGMHKKRYVYKVSNDTRYCVSIYLSKKNFIRGARLFDTKEEAYTYAKELYNQHFGEYPWE